MISAIVCVDENWGIGYKGDLLVKIPEDLKLFKEKTNGQTVIMGRKTYDSLPIKPLPNRENIIITSKVYKDEYGRYKDEDWVVYAELERVKDILKFIRKNLQYSCNKMFVIGGGSIYKELLPYCDTAYVTKIDYAFENVDTYFPNIDNAPEWEIESVSEIKEYNNIKYQFCTYKKGDTNGQN
jgi:dihydrofolate reductase